MQKILEEENGKHSDLVQGDFLDTYHNLSYKAVMGYLWVAEFCSQADFVVKTDDDLFVDLYEVNISFILQWIRHYFFQFWSSIIKGLQTFKKVQVQ